MKSIATFARTFAACSAMLSIGFAQSSDSTYSWRYYRPSNTGIQGDINEALWVGPDGNPWIGGYDPSFEEGGIAKFIQEENRWVNISNVDYPAIGHPELQLSPRVADIDVDSNGNMWMGTGRGALKFNPAVGPGSLVRLGEDNSGMPGGWCRGVEVASDGSIWFSSYSTVYAPGGLTRYLPTTNTWQNYSAYGEGKLAIQPKPGGGYYVWTLSGPNVARLDFGTGNWTVYPEANGNPSYILGNNVTDSSGNVWLYKTSDASTHRTRLDLRRPDGTWFNTPLAPFDQTITNSAAAIRTIGPGKVLVVDGGGTAYRFNGTNWQNLGLWQNTTSTYDVDQDAAGNIWVCGMGGAAKRSASTGVWTRYRLTNTSQYDQFVNDLTLAPNGAVYATANAGPGVGGMVQFDGIRWIGHNNLNYGLGQGWPFNTDNSSRVFWRNSTNTLLANPMFEGIHEYSNQGWTNIGFGYPTVGGLAEDAKGRLWAGHSGGILLKTGNTWTQVSGNGGEKIVPDPSRPGTVVAMGMTTITRTNGTTTQQWDLSEFPMLDTQSDQFKGIAVASNGVVWIGANTINLPDNSVVIKLNMNTGTYVTYERGVNWPFPGEYVMPLAATNDGRIWMQYDSDYLTALRGLFWFDGKKTNVFPAPPNGEPQWGGLPHAGIADCEVKQFRGGYELWMSTMSRGIAVLKVTPTTRIKSPE